LALDIVPASYELALINKLLYRQKGYQYRLKQVLAKMPDNLYDYILLDCPPSLAPLTLNALSTADLLIIPTQCEYYSARSLSQTIRLTMQIQKQSNRRLVYRVLITMYDQRNKINRLVLEQMQRGLKTVLFQTIIQIDTKLKESPAFGKPVTTYAPKSRGTHQYRALAKELASPDFVPLQRLNRRREVPRLFGKKSMPRKSESEAPVEKGRIVHESTEK
jgi:chromosome partitioning protein